MCINSQHLSTMEVGLKLFLIVILCLRADARGPLCFNCLAVSSPEECQTITECRTTETCFAEHFLFNDELPAFRFGCRQTQECQNDVDKRVVLMFCQLCCSGDLCNNNICTNGTVLPTGIPCIDCRAVSSTDTCSRITYCKEGEVCYSEESRVSHELKYTFGCLKKPVCKFFNPEIIGRRRSPRDTAPCHMCCEKPGCNYNGCRGHQMTTPSPIQTTQQMTQARDCWDLRTLYKITEDGVYEVSSPSGNKMNKMKVRCDMTTDGGGWTVFQRRGDGSVSFNRNYEAYRSLFGDLSTEFWIGNDFLHELTQEANQVLRVDICDWTNETRWAKYGKFSVGPHSDKYRLHVSNYTGTAGDSLAYHNMSQFSTPDADNDTDSKGNCADVWSSGWWFDACYYANLNGVYRPESSSNSRGIEWIQWINPHSFRSSEMKMRPSDATSSTQKPYTCPVM